MGKGYVNHHCHNKAPDRKWGLNVDDVMPGRDGPENLWIFKKSLSGVDIGPWRQTVKFQPLIRVVGDSAIESKS